MRPLLFDLSNTGDVRDDLILTMAPAFLSLVAEAERLRDLVFGDVVAAAVVTTVVVVAGGLVAGAVVGLKGEAAGLAGAVAGWTGDVF